MATADHTRAAHACEGRGLGPLGRPKRAGEMEEAEVAVEGAGQVSC